jgi:hypothetical protein
VFRLLFAALFFGAVISLAGAIASAAHFIPQMT